MKEIVDIVDKNDKVIGKADKEECHKKGFKHRVSTIWVFNNKGELLLQKRSKKMGIAPGKWDHSAAGHIGTGHSYLQAAKRELKEELGISCQLKKAIKLHNKSIYPGKIDDQIYTIFFCMRDGGFKIQKEELEKVKFFSVGEIDKRINKHPEQFCESFVKSFKILKRKGKIKC